MSLRGRCLKLVDRMRRIPASPQFDERPTTVTIRTTTWRGGRVGTEGPKDIAELVLEPSPKVRQLSQREIANSGGRYQAGDVKVGPITPAYGGGGYTGDQLAPSAGANGVQVVYVLSGYISGDYDRENLDNARSHSWFLILRRRRSTP